MSSGSKVELKSSNRSELARSAFQDLNNEESKRVHQFRVKSDETHKSEGKYIKSIVYGGLDGIITIFASVSSVAGASLSGAVVVIVGIANLFADALAMGFGDFLSSTAESEFELMEKKREEWECENYLEGEKDEMVQLYVDKGIPEQDARTVVEIISKNKSAFINIMMIEELGILPPDEDDKPWKAGIITFISFCFFGAIPLLPYLASVNTKQPAGLNTIFLASSVLTGFTLFVLGVITSRVTVEPWWKSGLKTFILGAIASVIAYLIGYALSFATNI